MIAAPSAETRSTIVLRSRRAGLSTIQMTGASPAIVVRHQPTLTERSGTCCSDASDAPGDTRGASKK